MPLKDFLMMGMNNVDPSPEVQSVIEKSSELVLNLPGTYLPPVRFYSLPRKLKAYQSG